MKSLIHCWVLVYNQSRALACSKNLLSALASALKAKATKPNDKAAPKINENKPARPRSQ